MNICILQFTFYLHDIKYAHQHISMTTIFLSNKSNVEAYDLRNRLANPPVYDITHTYLYDFLSG